MANCEKCKYREQCHDSEKELTCEEFVEYMQQQEPPEQFELEF